MASQPLALSLSLCDSVIVEERTKKVSLVGGFNHLKADNFPAVIQTFSVAAFLTSGLGKVTLELLVSRLDTGASAVAYRSEIEFRDKLSEVLFEARLRRFVFPVPGVYDFTLLSDGEWIAQRRLQILSEV